MADAFAIPPPIFPEGQQAFADWLFSSFFQKPGGGFDAYGMEPFGGSGQGPGLDMIGGLSPDLNSTILPNVFNNWQPWDAGTQYISDYLYNQNEYGQRSPELQQVQQYGGFGGPGHSGMVSALQYGAPSEAGRGVANLAEFGVTSQPMADFMRMAVSGGLNPYRAQSVPMPMRRAA